MKLWVLGSGSGGNAVLVEDGDARVLIDAGFSPRELARRLGAIGVAPESISAAVLTHEHTDHVRGAAGAAKRWGWSLHATAGTVQGTPALSETTVHTFAAGDAVRVGRIELRSVATRHDAREPVALVVTSLESGVRGTVAYDMGRVTPAVRDALRDLDFLVLESNHDEGMLRTGPYPPYLQRRIAGGSGHLSNVAAADAARDCATRGLQHVVLAHLSEVNNSAEVARETVGSALARTAFRGTLHVAKQDGVIGPIAPRARRRRSAAAQLELAL